MTWSVLWFAQNSLPLRWQRQPNIAHNLRSHVVICSKFITFAVTKTTPISRKDCELQLWFAQNSLPLRWQRQRSRNSFNKDLRCDLLKIHYLCGDKDNKFALCEQLYLVVICSKFITFAVTKTTGISYRIQCVKLWFAQNSLPLRWQRQPAPTKGPIIKCCDLLKIHYLCGDKDNKASLFELFVCVVICSKFITFAVTKTTCISFCISSVLLWFAQNSLPLRWQRQRIANIMENTVGCDLLKIHYLCGDKDNLCLTPCLSSIVVICSKFITFAVTKTTLMCLYMYCLLLWFAQNSLPLRWQRQH